MSEDPEPDLGTARRWWGLARYDPEDLDVEDVVAALDGAGDGAPPAPAGPSGTGTGRRLAAETLAEAARADPAAVVDHLDPESLAPLLGHGTVGTPVARVLGAAGTVRDPPLEPLAERLRTATGTELHDAVAGLDRTAELDPDRVRPLTDALVEATVAATDANAGGVARGIFDRLVPTGTPTRTDDPRALRDAATTTLARVALRDPELQSSLRELITHRDPGRRVCGALAVGTAVRLGCPPLEDAADELVFLLDDPTEAVRRAAMRGLAAAAESYPDAAAGDDDFVLACRGSDALDDAATALLTRLARADRSTFESLLDWVANGRSAEGLLAGLRSQGPDERAVEAIAGSVAAHPERFAAADRALAGMFDVDAGAAARAVRTVARSIPGELDHAVDPLLNRTLATSRHQVRHLDATREALATLARGQPAVPRRLVERLSDQVGSRLGITTRVCAAVAETAPGPLLAAAPDGDDREGPAPLLREQFRNRPKPGVARALAHLGRADPSTVEPVVGDVVDGLQGILDGAVRASRRAALFELGGTVARIDPDATDRVGTATFETLRDRARDASKAAFPATTVGTLDPRSGTVVGVGHATGPNAALHEEAVPFLTGLAVGRKAHGEALIDFLDRPALRDPAVAAVATAAADAPGHFERHADRLAAVTTVPDRETRRTATRALATLASEGPGGNPAVADRLTDLVYDPDPVVRGWAAFGVGSLDDPDPGALDRVERVADRDGDDAAPPATLGLVLGGRRRPRTAVEELETLAGEAAAPTATAAVEVLGETNSAAARDALRAALLRADDPEVRERIRAALDSRSAGSAGTERPAR